MSAHYKWYPDSEETIVPWNARYSFPSQANKAVKMTPRIPPKSGGVFAPGQVIRLEFPAQGYVNPLNTTIEFDVTIETSNGAATEVTRFQNNIQSCFNRVRLLYGATPIEDIINYNVIVRSLTEWTATNQDNSMDQQTINEGIGGVLKNASASYGVRPSFIHGYVTNNGGNKNAPDSSLTRRYQVGLALGMFTQDKLIPVKFMASQLAIEITLESAAGCMVTTNTPTPITNPNYSVSNVNLIPELLEFDASYDTSFLAGLRDGGVPIKFSSWHTYQFGSGQSNLNLQIQERSRSVKALFALQRRFPATNISDSGATFFSTTANSTLQQYQFRIGGRYYPASPVQCAQANNSSRSNGGAECITELQKCLNTVGDYRLSSNVNTLRWAPTGVLVGSTFGSAFNEHDYLDITTGYDGEGQILTTPTAFATTLETGSNLGSACFAASTNLETTNGTEISGLNAEEQSDISFLATYSAPQSSSCIMEVYSYYDAMMILKENNVIELVQ